MSSRVNLTALNGMLGADLAEQLDRHVAWNLRVLDLKDRLFGRKIGELDHDQVRQVSRAVQDRALVVHTLSTDLMDDDVEKGEAAFRARWDGAVDRLIAIAEHLRPQRVRLLGARSAGRPASWGVLEYLADRHPWVLPLYREWIDRFAAAGLHVTVENEIGATLMSCVEDISDFMQALDRSGTACYTWDIVNLWQVSGAIPNIETYERLRPWIGLIHVKGGRSDEAGRLRWAATLKDSDWPVVPILNRVIGDGIADTVCLNPPHGDLSTGYSHGLRAYEQDIRYLQASLQELPTARQPI